MNFDLFSPTDFRYSVKELTPFLSEESSIKYKVKVEVALVKALCKHNICSARIAKEIEAAGEKVTAAEVYAEEDRIKHDIRALVNIIKKNVSLEAQPFIHLTATSYDIVDTSNALRYRDAVKNVVLPDMIALAKVWIAIARKEAETIQIGRTHGQHAIPITFGFAIANYLNRWCERLQYTSESLDYLVGKFSGAVGAYNASALFFDNPEQFEKDVLSELGLNPASISTQIVPPEANVDLYYCLLSSFGVLANFADDMRHLQRSEIGEVGEPFAEAQVGSSTMPQKRNPINFENIKSAWKTCMPRIVSVCMDQISEHQRDLTNSLSQRYYPEIIVLFDASVRRAIKISSKMIVDKENIKKNFEMNSDKIIAEPLQILLSFYGYPNAHEKIRQLSMTSYQTGRKLTELIVRDDEIAPYLSKFTEKQRNIISNPEKYVGIAAKKTRDICDKWEKMFERW